jgi:hypothetical protein
MKTDARKKADEARWLAVTELARAIQVGRTDLTDCIDAIMGAITAHLEASIKDPKSPLGYLYAMRDEDLQAEHEVASEVAGLEERIARLERIRTEEIDGRRHEDYTLAAMEEREGKAAPAPGPHPGYCSKNVSLSEHYSVHRHHGCDMVRDQPDPAPEDEVELPEAVAYYRHATLGAMTFWQAGRPQRPDAAPANPWKPLYDEPTVRRLVEERNTYHQAARRLVDREQEAQKEIAHLRSELGEQRKHTIDLNKANAELHEELASRPKEDTDE